MAVYYYYYYVHHYVLYPTQLQALLMDIPHPSKLVSNFISAAEIGSTVCCVYHVMCLMH